MLFQTAVLAIFTLSSVSADVRVSIPAVRDNQVYYIDQLKTQDMDNMVRSNIVNQHKKRTGTEAFMTMLPCRSDIAMTTPVVYNKLSTVQYNLRFNNPHDGQCEINLWKNGMVMPLMKPKVCGGGVQRSQFNFTLPANTPTCGPNEGCFMQFYFYSVEPRDYSQCTDIVFAEDGGVEATAISAPITVSDTTAALNLGSTAPALKTTSASLASGRSAKMAQLRLKRRATDGMTVGKMFQDGQDSKNANNEYNQYRGQQTTTPQHAARFELEKCVGKGNQQKINDGQLDNKRNQLAQKIKTLITDAEKPRNAELAAQDDTLKKEAEAAKENAIKTFKQGVRGSTSVHYPQSEPLSGARDYGTTIDGTDNKRQNTNTYIAGMDFVKILAGVQAEVTQMCTDRAKAGDLGAYSDGSTVGTTVVGGAMNATSTVVPAKAGKKGKTTA